MVRNLSITLGHLLQGIISVKTLTELERMRRGGVKLVLITGARLSTMLTRMAFLPAADAYVCENGGRIYYPDATLTVALPIAEDMEWRRTHNATGINHGQPWPATFHCHMSCSNACCNGSALHVAMDAAVAWPCMQQCLQQWFGPACSNACSSHSALACRALVQPCV